MERSAALVDPVILPPHLALLLKRVAVVEKLPVAVLWTLILQQGDAAASPEQKALAFCAHYFAQAATLQGHEAARHGEGTATIRNVMAAMHANTKSYHLAILVANDEKVSEDRERYNRKL